MKILHIISGLGPGGAEHMLWRLIAATRGIQHFVYSLSGRGTLSESLRSAGAVMLNDDAGGHRKLHDLMVLRRYAAQHSPDVIQGWMYHGSMAALVAKSAAPRATLFWNIRQSLADTKLTKLSTYAVIYAQAICSRIPQGIIYNSEIGALNHEALGFAKGRRILLPNGFDCNLFAPDEAARLKIRKELGIADDRLVIGLIARYDPWKNHAGFFQMAATLADRYPDAVFVLAGKGINRDNPDLLAMIEDRLLDRVFLLSDRRDVGSINAALDIACNVSHGEGFPNAVGEAMACGIPCVVTPVGAAAELVGDCGVVAASTQVDDLVQAMEGMIRMPAATRRALGVAARERILTHFSIEAVAKRYLSLYEQSRSVVV